MIIHKSKNWVLWYETVGFGSMIGLVWLNEFTGLQQLLFGGESHVGDWRLGAIDTALLVVVWAVIFVATKRLLAHLLYLEGFLRVCAWCRKVNYKGNWMRMEEYFEKGFHVDSTHGMCPECLKKFEADYVEQERQRVGAARETARNVVPEINALDGHLEARLEIPTASRADGPPFKAGVETLCPRFRSSICCVSQCRNPPPRISSCPPAPSSGQ